MPREAEVFKGKLEGFCFSGGREVLNRVAQGIHF